MCHLLRTWVAFAAFSTLIMCASAQQPSTNPTPKSLADYAREVQGNKPAAVSAAPAQSASEDSVADRAREKKAKDLAKVKVSPEEAQKILGSVDTLLKFASDDSGLPIRSVVKRRMISRDDLATTMKTRKIDDEETKHLQAEELTLKKFGFVPKIFSTGKFVENMYEEQVSGYYDAHTKVISLLNWVQPEGQLDVLAHELTHALQDQNYNLMTWQHNTPSNHHPTTFQVSANEATAESSARQAVVEGQAMVVLIDHQFQQRGMDLKLENMRGASEVISQYMSMVIPDTPALHAAPVFLREAMAFPYREGLVFEMELLDKGGKNLAFQKVFARPPLNTHEILHPEEYESEQKIVAPHIPDLSKILADQYEIEDSGGLGELDVRSLVKQLGDTRLAENIARGWRGGSYLAMKRKGVATGDATTADIGIMYVSAWDSSATALRFAKFYADAVPKRYREAAALNSTCTGYDCPLQTFMFKTEEGIVYIECRTNLVIITESIDPKLMEAVHLSLRKANSGPAAHKTLASIPPDLSLRFASSPVFAGLDEIMREQVMKMVERQQVP
jgi:hypothetical protein